MKHTILLFAVRRESAAAKTGDRNRIYIYIYHHHIVDPGALELSSCPPRAQVVLYFFLLCGLTGT